MAELLESPKYFGDQEMLANTSDAAEKPVIHQYFKCKRICEWSLSDFLVSNNDVSDFIDGVNLIRKDKRTAGVIRVYANTWFRYLEGDAGKIRIATAQEAAMNSIRNAKLAEQACDLAQIYVSGILKKRQTKDSLDLDAASTAQEMSHFPLNLVFDTDDDFAFHGSLGDIDISDMFSDLYSECLAVPYDPDNMADFLAIAGILFLDKQPTALQKKCFGDTYEVLYKKMKQLLPTITKEEGKKAKAFCRDCRDVFRDEERQSEDRNKARKALRRRVLEEDGSTLTELYLYGSKLHTICNPLSEADQISGFVLRMLSCITDQADETRLAYIGSEPRHPDLILKHKEEKGIGFGEVSLTSCNRKDTGDLCRCAIWSKRVLDQLVTKYEGIDDIAVLFMQVVDRTCSIYQIRRSLYRTTTAEWTIPDSRLCQIQVLNETMPVRAFRLEGFESPKPAASRTEVLVEMIAAAQKEVPESALLEMTGFRRKFVVLWRAQKEMETQYDSLMKGNLRSLYDEWGQGHIPVSTDMKNHLRPWAVLGGGKVPDLLAI
ncbi:hypothetical protein DFQ26_006114 [Actinomortierella ambigua]|nr:hypothetical protein DFQ26_006114 [Actinomortierella ambigua]